MAYETTVAVRYRDVDAMGHVNNAVYATYLEQSRVDYFDDLLDADLSREGAVLASLSLDYEHPIQLDDGPVTVRIEVPNVGRSSLPMSYELVRDDGVVAATAETVQVAYDRSAGEPTAIADDWRETIESYHGLDGSG